MGGREIKAKENRAAAPEALIIISCGSLAFCEILCVIEHPSLALTIYHQESQRRCAVLTDEVQPSAPIKDNK